MLIKIAAFSGIAPRLSAKLLQDNQAQIARNVRLASGEIRPLRAPLQIAAELVASPKAIWQLKDKWLSWASRVKAVPSPIADDTDYRLYYTGDGHPKKTWYAHATQGGVGPFPATRWYDLGVPAHSAAPALTAGGGSVPAGTYAYVITLVSRFGPEGGGVMEESRPSAPALITLAAEGGVTVARGSVPVYTPGWREIKCNYVAWRVYRSTSAGAYQMVAELAIGVSSWHDSLAQPTSTVLPSNDWHEPPDDLQGLVAMPNGFMAAFRGNEILFSEPWYPHAWPIAYRMSITGRIKAIAPAGSALIVLTDDYPYILTGAHPDSMSQERIEIMSPCASAESVVSDGYSVMYASRDGIAAISASGQHQLLTRSLFDIEDWRRYSPYSAVGMSYYGAYVMFYHEGGDAQNIKALALNVQDSPPLVELDIEGIASHKEVFLTDDARLLEYDADPEQTLDGLWRSKVFTLPYHKNLSAMAVDAEFDDGTVVVRLIGDGVQRAEMTVTGPGAVRLPAGFKCKDIEVEIAATCAVRSVTLASTVSELRGTQ